MKWLDNLIMISKDGKTTICPFCQSNKVRFKRTQIDEKSKVGYIDVWCDSCKKAYHMSRVKVDNKSDNIDIPKNLEY